MSTDQGAGSTSTGSGGSGRVGTHPAHLTRCSGESCRQGRQPCQTPDACRLSDDSDFGALEGLTRGIGYIAVAWGVIGVLVFLVWLAWWPL